LIYAQPNLDRVNHLQYLLRMLKIILIDILTMKQYVKYHVYIWQLSFIITIVGKLTDRALPIGDYQFHTKRLDA
jgi:hypothetical protein